MKTVIIDLKSVKSKDSKHSSEWSYPWAKTGVSKLSVKGQIANILGFVGPLVLVAVTQLCCNENKPSTKYASEWTWLYSSKTSFTKAGGGLGLTIIYSLFTLV